MICLRPKVVAMLKLSSVSTPAQIPTQITNLTGLTDLVIYTSALTGNIPAALSSLTTLTNIDFESNSGLTGSIPPQLSTLTALQQILCTGSKLVGSLPPQLSTLKVVNYFAFDDNGLSGKFPVSYSALSSIKDLYVQGNQLTGTVPAQLSVLTSLTAGNAQLWLKNNQLTGNLPPAISSLKSALDITGNSAMCGLIPDFPGLATAGTGLGMACPSPPSRKMIGLIHTKIRSRQASMLALLALPYSLYIISHPDQPLTKHISNCLLHPSRSVWKHTRAFPAP